MLLILDYLPHMQPTEENTRHFRGRYDRSISTGVEIDRAPPPPNRVIGLDLIDSKSLLLDRLAQNGLSPQ